jgi:hypothetical protein
VLVSPECGSAGGALPPFIFNRATDRRLDLRFGENQPIYWLGFRLPAKTVSRFLQPEAMKADERLSGGHR